MDSTKAYMAIAGGALIALSSSLRYVLYGRITGMSGMLFSVVGVNFSPLFPLNLCFLVGLISSVDFWNILYGKFLWGERVLDEDSSTNPISWVIGGLLIGYGVRYGGGCTSGHGVCGIPRGSLRSLIAVCIFMAFGVATATYLGQAPLPPSNSSEPVTASNLPSAGRIALFAYQLAAAFYIGKHLTQNSRISEALAPAANLLFGSLFGLGLLVSGMCSRAKILAFLNFNESWDASLLLVMAAAVGINSFTFQITMMKKKPLVGDYLDLPNTSLDLGIFVGPALFGIGWGITGLCPGPAMANITLNSNGLGLVLLIFAGQSACDYVQSKLKQS